MTYRHVFTVTSPHSGLKSSRSKILGTQVLNQLKPTANLMHMCSTNNHGKTARCHEYACEHEYESSSSLALSAQMLSISIKSTTDFFLKSSSATTPFPPPAWYVRCKIRNEQYLEADSGWFCSPFIKRIHHHIFGKTFPRKVQYPLTKVEILSYWAGLISNARMDRWGQSLWYVLPFSAISCGSLLPCSLRSADTISSRHSSRYVGHLLRLFHSRVKWRQRGWCLVF